MHRVRNPGAANRRGCHLAHVHLRRRKVCPLGSADDIHTLTSILRLNVLCAGLAPRYGRAPDEDDATRARRGQMVMVSEAIRLLVGGVELEQDHTC